MDRRRFVPKSEGLEARELLSFFGNTNKLNNFNNTALAVQILRSARIERLPGYLQSLESGRIVPPDVIAPLEDDLRAIESKLTPASSAVLTLFNHELRTTIPHSGLSLDDATTLNQDFGAVLTSSGADPFVTAKFQVDMNNLARVDVHDPNPAQLASNDYALVAQLVEGIGVPIRTPPAPLLLAADAIPPRRLNMTAKAQPRVYGTYDLGTTVQILDASGNVVGSAKVPSTGRYVATITTPLSLGTHQLFALGTNNLNGNHSLQSAPLTLTVVTPPQGPKHHK